MLKHCLIAPVWLSLQTGTAKGTSLLCQKMLVLCLKLDSSLKVWSQTNYELWSRSGCKLSFPTFAKFLSRPLFLCLLGPANFPPCYDSRLQMTGNASSFRSSWRFARLVGEQLCPPVSGNLIISKGSYNQVWFLLMSWASLCSFFGNDTEGVC